MLVGIINAKFETLAYLSEGKKEVGQGRGTKGARSVSVLFLKENSEANMTNIFKFLKLVDGYLCIIHYYFLYCYIGVFHKN